MTREENFRAASAGLGGGSIWDVGCYPISYARLLAGVEPTEVFGWQVTGRGGIDESFIGQMRFPGGIHAQFDSGFKSPHRVQIEVVGSRGRLQIGNPYKPGIGEQIRFTRRDKTEVIQIPGQELYIGEVEDMADVILEGRTPRISLEDSRGNLAAILALIQSARTGKVECPGE